jgi:hypothetical protein
MMVVCAIDWAVLGYHLHQVSQTPFEPKIPAHTQNDDSAVEVAP